MAAVSRRFVKVIRLVVVLLFLCVLFVATHKYIDDGSISVGEYTSYLQNYINAADNGYKVGSFFDDQERGDDGGGEKTTVPLEDTIAESDTDSLQRTKNLKGFYEQVFQFLQTNSPVNKTERLYNEKCPLNGDIGARPDDYENWYKLTRRELSHCLEVSKEEAAMLEESHASFVENLGQLVLPKDSYKGKGIVTVGGGKFSLLSLLIIRTLRNLGTTLPVEVFIPPKDEGETEFCDVLLPQYNAKCIYISDILPKYVIDEFDFKGYQFKSIAMIASSFNDLLLLDADNFPIKKLDHIFDQEPYKSTGLVLWPDFWRRTTNPIYYKISGVPVNLHKRVRNSIDDITPPEVYTENMDDLSDVPYHDFEGTIPDVSTESGQLMINKSKHLPTVLLALYYNVNGPSWYYPIFSQKAAGEGDKETFIASANFYGLPFYQVKTVTGVDGYHQNDNKGFRGVAMLQHDFVQDYRRYQGAAEDIASTYQIGEGAKKLKYDKEYTPENFYRKYFDGGDTDNSVSEVDIMFVHSNLPKFDPLTLWKDQDLIVDGKHIRSYTNLKKLNGYDIEMENFKIFNEHLCLQRSHFKYLDSILADKESDWQSMCEYISDRLMFLAETHRDAVRID